MAFINRTAEDAAPASHYNDFLRMHSLRRNREMKTAAILISMCLFAPLAGCAHADVPDCRQARQQLDCPRDAKKTKEAEEAKDAKQKNGDEAERPTPRTRSAPGIVERPIPVPPPASVRREPGPLPAPAPAPVRPAPPVPATSCDAGGCWDNNANRYGGGASGTYTDKAGRPCHRVGTWIQCF
jgi:hypothetical protein